MQRFERTTLLIGVERMAWLARRRVLVVGLGGVGSHATEALARAPIGHLTLVDHDRVSLSNLNRQLYATTLSLGRAKAELAAERCLSINPEVTAEACVAKLTPEGVGALLDLRPDYVVDAIDDTLVKLALISGCLARGVPIVSSMGAASRLDPSRVRVADIAKTRFCPLARQIRKGLRRLGISEGVQTVFSDEPAQCLPVALRPPPEMPGAKRPHGSISYLPAIFGFTCAAVVIRDLLSSGPRSTTEPSS